MSWTTNLQGSIEVEECRLIWCDAVWLL
jgi:hypothetical protein